MNQRTSQRLTALLLVICWASRMDAQQIETYFSPNGGCAAATIKQINAATTSIDVAAYICTSSPLANAIIEARKRNIAIRIIVDRAQEAATTPAPKILKSAGMDMRTDPQEKLHHNKYVIIDRSIVITGSYNWSDNAEHNNAENLVVIHDTATAAAFAADFAKHWNHSRPFVARQRKPRPRLSPQATNPTPPAPPTKKGF